MTYRKAFSRIGFALLVVMAGTQISQTILVLLGNRFLPGLVEGNYLTYLITEVTMYGVALPLMWLMTKGLPVLGKGERKKMTAGQFLFWVPITEGAGYICSFAGVLLLLPLMVYLVLKGGVPTDINPMVNLLSRSDPLAMIPAVVILSPIVEEWIFRGLLLDRLRAFGDGTAILVSGLAFGIFHGNPLQFLYATMVGFVFAYVTLKTNTIRYSIGLHIILNFIGSISSFVLMAGNPRVMMIGMVALMVVIFGFVVAGVIMFICNYRKIQLCPGPCRLEKGTRFKTIVLNPGMICFLIAAIIVFASFFISILKNVI